MNFSEAKHSFPSGLDFITQLLCSAVIHILKENKGLGIILRQKKHLEIVAIKVTRKMVISMAYQLKQEKFFRSLYAAELRHMK